MDRQTDQLVAVQFDLPVNTVAVWAMAGGGVPLHECGVALPITLRVLIQADDGAGSVLPRINSLRVELRTSSQIRHWG